MDMVSPQRALYVQHTNIGVDKQSETFKHTYLNKHHGLKNTSLNNMKGNSAT